MLITIAITQDLNDRILEYNSNLALERESREVLRNIIKAGNIGLIANLIIIIIGVMVSFNNNFITKIILIIINRISYYFENFYKILTIFSYNPKSYHQILRFVLIR